MSIAKKFNMVSDHNGIIASHNGMYYTKEIMNSVTAESEIERLIVQNMYVYSQGL